eukprot:scaffold34677_cov137-Amphora_coffeaeformis.AAC.1
MYKEQNVIISYSINSLYATKAKCWTREPKTLDRTGKPRLRNSIPCPFWETIRILENWPLHSFRKMMLSWTVEFHT